MSIQFIGCDIAREDSEDNSAVSCVCSKCNHIVFIKTFTNKEKISYPRYKRCPNCGTLFKFHKLI